MKRLALIFLSLIFVRIESQADVAVSHANSVFAIYKEDWRLTAAGTPRLVLVLWANDRIIWSENQVEGGPPYRSAQLRAGTFRRFVSMLQREGRFSEKELRQPHIAWDSAFTTVLARHNGREILMRFGIEAASPTAKYLHFRSVWDRIRRQAEALIPREGAIVRGEMMSDHGTIFWSDRERRPE